MLILECVETKKKLRGGGGEGAGGWNGRMARMGYYPFSGLYHDRESPSRQGFLSLVSQQAIPCHDRARRLGTRPGRCARGKPAWAVGTRTRNTRTTETHNPVSR